MWVFWTLIFACGGNKHFGKEPPNDLTGEVDFAQIHYTCLEDGGVIQKTPREGTFEDYSDEGFTRYAAVVAPNGGVIPIFAREGVSDSKLLRARNILRFFLTDVSGSLHGADKSDVANKMAENGAVLMMPEGAHEEGNEPHLNAQPLYDHETPVEGGPWYMENDYDHRDAAFEEIFHLVHDAGIGTYLPGALPDARRATPVRAQARRATG